MPEIVRTPTALADTDPTIINVGLTLSVALAVRLVTPKVVRTADTDSVATLERLIAAENVCVAVTDKDPTATRDTFPVIPPGAAKRA